MNQPPQVSPDHVGRTAQIIVGALIWWPARKAHPCFRVADLETSREAFSAAGVPITPDESIPWTRRFFANDPFGNRLEFLQEGDSFFP